MLATDVRLLYEKLLRDLSMIYESLDLDFEGRWFPVFYALTRKAPQSMVSLAREAGYTHAAISQMTAPMIKKGLLRVTGDPLDSRKKLLVLTTEGKHLQKRLERVWRHIREANEELQREAGVDLLADLKKVSDALDTATVYDRIQERVGLPPRSRFRIVPYRPLCKKYFASLNETWLAAHLEVTTEDAEYLGDPNGRIVRKGGEILFAVMEDEVVGSCALIMHPDGAAELAYLSVVEQARRGGIGRALVEGIVQEAAERSVRHLYLRSAPSLVGANRLFRKVGFRKVRNHPLPGRHTEDEVLFMRIRAG